MDASDEKDSGSDNNPFKDPFSSATQDKPSNGSQDHPISPFLQVFSATTPENPETPGKPTASEVKQSTFQPPSFPPPSKPVLETKFPSKSEVLPSQHLPKPAFFVTSTPSVECHSISEYLDVLTVEIVVPKDIILQNPAPYGELNRIKAGEEQLQKIKNQALDEMKTKARKIGADGVVGVSFQCCQFDAVVCLFLASGTAVKLA